MKYVYRTYSPPISKLTEKDVEHKLTVERIKELNQEAKYCLKYGM